MDNSITISGLSASYGAVKVLQDVSMTVSSGKTAVLLGVNGNGKSTLIKCIMGICRATSGTIAASIDGTSYDLTTLTTEEIVDLGIAVVPEGRRLFPQLTVEENLMLAGYRAKARQKLKSNLEFCYETFPRLFERRRQQVRLMSGGEQQMVALARAIVLDPKILLVDEPSVGLAPILVERMIDAINELKIKRGLTVLMAEQNFKQAIRIADAGYVIVHGQIAFEASTADELNNSELIKTLYMGH